MYIKKTRWKDVWCLLDPVQLQSSNNIVEQTATDLVQGFRAGWIGKSYTKTSLQISTCPCDMGNAIDLDGSEVNTHTFVRKRLFIYIFSYVRTDIIWTLLQPIGIPAESSVSASASLHRPSYNNLNSQLFIYVSCCNRVQYYY